MTLFMLSSTPHDTLHFSRLALAITCFNKHYRHHKHHTHHTPHTHTINSTQTTNTTHTHTHTLTHTHKHTHTHTHSHTLPACIWHPYRAYVKKLHPPFCVTEDSFTQMFFSTLTFFLSFSPLSPSPHAVTVGQIFML